ncbi:MAG TPA: hypothetical protein VKB76_04145, partial [Ktedonobacterales bacterium]|nr:hypothetical protein [Ktedonobacterales bacterium]
MHRKHFRRIALTSLVVVTLLFSFWAVSQLTAHAAGQKASSNPYGDPHLVSMFDGTTLNGWTSS